MLDLPSLYDTITTIVTIVGVLATLIVMNLAGKWFRDNPIHYSIAMNAVFVQQLIILIAQGLIKGESIVLGLIIITVLCGVSNFYLWKLRRLYR